MKKGVSITSLTMYVLVLTIIIGIIAAFNANILGDSNNFVKTTKMFEQYTKFNMFFLEVLGENPTVQIISDGLVVIYTSSGSSMFEYDSTNKVIKYTSVDGTITACEYVDTLQFRAVGNTLRTNIRLAIGEVVYQPQIVMYAVGGWAE